MAAPKGEKLTEKQEAFVRAYFETGNGGEAYRQAYDVEPNARDSWIYVEAQQLLDRPKIARRLKELRDQAEKLSIFTRQKALEELEEARVLAFSTENPAAAVSATNSKAKLCGYDRVTRIEHSGPGGGPIPTQNIPANEEDLIEQAKRLGLDPSVLGLSAGVETKT